MAFRPGPLVKGSVPIIIVGGGLAGSLAALALAARRPELPLLLLEAGERFGGNHVWSFFDTDLGEAERDLVGPMVTRRWADHEVRFPARKRVLGLGYNSVRSADLDARVRAALPRDRYRLGAAAAFIGEDHVVLEGGESIEAAAVIDARGPGPMPGLDLAWQKFVGRTYRFDRPHGVERPVIMDACVDQDSGYRFVYSLPFDDETLMVEDTYYSTSPVLDVPMLGGRADSYARARGLDPAAVIEEETGVLPVLLGGACASLWPRGEAPVARLGLRGGFFHPTTGYSLADAARNAILLAGLSELGSRRRLHDFFRARAEGLWSERRFYQRLNRMLFRAADPPQRYKVLEHFYRLPEAVVGRFYAGRTTALDKVRILSGRPPVPLGRALWALREQRR
jgi:lycopene beta-cyclase